MKEVLEKEIKSILSDFGVENPKVNFDMPAHMEMGDYSTNVAMAHAKQLGEKPLDLALRIKESLVEKRLKHISRIDVIAPGFINFFFDEHYFNKNVGEILKEGDKFGKSKQAKGYKVMIEHTQPNPFKEFHIGHLMNNTVGESVARIVRAHGAMVKTSSYHGDVGMHVAKAVWAIRNGAVTKEAYATGNKAFEENKEAKEEIADINKKIYDRSDGVINKIYDTGRKESLDYFESIYKKLDNHFDFHFYESESGEVGKKLVLENIGKVFEESDGAVVFKGENFGPKTHTRVFLNSDRLPTYEAKELGLAQIKKEKFAYDTSITITADEQDSFFKVVEVAIGEVFPELKGKLKHLSHGMLKLPSGKMSSRTGSVITAETLIDQIREKIIQEHETEVATAEVITLGAIKYSILRQAIGGDIIFDFDKSISFEGDSGPYLQYSAVRANSLLKKAEGVVDLEAELPSGWQTTNLEKVLERFPSVVSRAGQEYAPHHIVTYLIDLAGEFNSFYASHKIIDEKDPTSSYRLALTKAFVQVMATGLDLLGIKVPSQM
ncbi:MAG TPA: arginine--tRNA ligase [Candidatus Paceibacterota bacterium]